MTPRLAIRRVGTAHQPTRILLTLLLLTGAACRPAGHNEPASVRDRLAQGPDAHTPANSSKATTGAPVSTPSGPVESGEAIALVNGIPVDRRAFNRLLIESRGLPLLQQLVLRETARQEAQRRGLAITPADIDQEYDQTLQASRFNGKDPEKLTPARREQLIEEWTQGRGVTRQELAVAIERQAYLRKLVEGTVEITDDMLRTEYSRVHGERAEVRHIQIPALRVWEQIKQRLQQGDRFEDLVADYSQNALSKDKRGLLPPFAENDPTVPASFAKAAFALQPGEVSNPIELDGSYHILKLEKKIPADNLPFEDVKESLRKNLIARLTAEQMDRLSENLLMKTRLQIEDRTLREQYTRRKAAGQITGPGLAD